MADTVTVNYAFTKPEVGASADTWGTKYNTNADLIDGYLKAVSDVANAALSRSTGGTVSGNVILGGDNTIGGGSGSALVINSAAASVPNGLNFDANTFVIDSANNRVGFGKAAPTTQADFLGTTAAPAWRAWSASGQAAYHSYFQNTIQEWTVGQKADGSFVINNGAALGGTDVLKATAAGVLQNGDGEELATRNMAETRSVAGATSFQNTDRGGFVRYVGTGGHNFKIDNQSTTAIDDGAVIGIVNATAFSMNVTQDSSVVIHWYNGAALTTGNRIIPPYTLARIFRPGTGGGFNNNAWILEGQGIT